MPILATKGEAKELFDAIDECKPYCQINIEIYNDNIKEKAGNSHD